MSTVLLLIIMSLIAGILMGIVGMASLTLYPVLLAVGIPPITANATITVAQVGAGVGTVLSSLKELRHHWGKACEIAAFSTIGSILGAILLTHSSSKAFQNIVPVFIFIAGIMILSPKRSTTDKGTHSYLQIISWISLMLVGVYIGYFGAAAGLLLIAVLSKLVDEDYAVINAMRNFSSFINNIISSVIFIIRIPIAWKVIIPLLLGLFVGGYIGPAIVRIIPAKYIRKAVGIFAIVLAIVLGWKSYF
ncbi:sulfite exporter TauE/SafE family protein [Secundilactobacillus folii]|uniref:Probable membrane transporter protein n=1 Tax=Secundilactobacillus folii TaxID=2678357 RepID=A0A7X2XXP3_9LACO|nr:sulfite exporter TauE/SafE family protein [Secundilactobacillus folii]MTV82843.1 TSUP family transporter [Secundilactobacillus folii]